MDPLTHIVVGRAVVAAAEHRERAARGIAAAAILGALSPDIDSAVALSGWDRYVRIHEFVTHSILGAVVMACLTAIVVRAVVRFRGGDTPFVVLLGAAAAGAMSHLILDIICGGRIRPGWPLIRDRVTVPLVAMADPWFIAICLAGLVALRPGRRSLRLVSRAIIGSVVVLLATKGALLARATRSSPVAASLPAIEPHWGSLTEWSAFERTDAAVRAWTISGAGGPARLSMSHPLAAETPLVRASRSLEAVQNFLSVHAFTFAIERPADLGQTEVLWSDLRYCWITTPDDAPMVRVDGSMSCAIFVGGLFSSDARALMQRVKIGSIVQTRMVTR